MADADMPPAEKKLHEQAASSLFQLVWGIAGDLYSQAAEKLAVRKAIRDYLTSYNDRFGHVRVLGMSKPVSLEQIYTRVRVVSPDHLTLFVDAAKMEDEFRKASRRQPAFLQQANDKIENAINAANDNRFLNILGAPGSGKTTLLRRIGHEALYASSKTHAGTTERMWYTWAKIPVLLELKYFREGDLALIPRIAQEFHTCGFPLSKRFVKRALERGKLLVLLDGLDEVPEGRLAKVVEEIKNFTDQYGKSSDTEGNRFVTSCRTAHFKSSFFPRFADLVVAEFDDNQIRQFSRLWFSSFADKQKKVCQDFLAILFSEAHKSTLELTRTPLLLTLTCMVFRSGKEIPRVKSVLYRRAFELLLRDWFAEKLIDSDPLFSEFSTELELQMLQTLAYEQFKNDRFFFSSKQVESHIGSFLKETVNAPKDLESNEILKAIEKEQGIIVRRTDELYSFSHLTFQEYLTAVYCESQEDRVIHDVVNRHLTEERWAVVFELLGGTSKGGYLIGLMAMRARILLEQATGKSPRLVKLSAWLERYAVASNEGRSPMESLLSRCLFLMVFICLRGLVLSSDVSADRLVARDHLLTKLYQLATSLGASTTFQGGLLDCLRYAMATIRSRKLHLSESSKSVSRAYDYVHQDLMRPATAVKPYDALIGDLVKQLDLFDPEAMDDDEVAVISSHISCCLLIIKCKMESYTLGQRGWDEVCNSLIFSPLDR